MNRPTDQQTGIYYMLLASLLFALTMVFAKLLSDSMGSVEVTFWRNTVGLAIIASTLFRTPIKNVGGKPFTLIFRGVIGTVALLTFFYTVGETTLSNSIIYAKTEPIFTAILAFFLLKEKPSVKPLLAIVIGFSGVVVINGGTIDYLHVMGILTGFLSALAYTSVRSLKDVYDPRTVVLSFMISGIVLPLILMGISPYFHSELLAFALSGFVMPEGFDWIWIMMMGIAAAAGQIYMTKAYFHAEAGIVSAVSYSVVLFATAFGIVLGDTYPTPTIIAGGILIILSGVLLSVGVKKKIKA